MKKFLSFVLVLALTLSTTASAKSILLNYADGSDSKVIAISDIQNVTVDGDNLLVNLLGGNSITTAISSLSSLSISDQTSGVTAVADDIRAIGICVVDGNISVSGITAPTPVSVYTVGGAEVVSTVVSPGETSTLPTLDGGQYIIKIGQTTLKFVKK
jgi:hypothetical protein